ncbi:sensory rhodopsin transducer [Planctomicrobium sp. SH661]|uniref:sensory rhodopsin transducer n=1 Tax=Planctomicrobium sp. SH661 TaxID=3448124 RepID=UPI003F5C2E8B
MAGSRPFPSPSGGAHTWYFADGYLPEKVASGPMEAHEALMILNTQEHPADVLLDFYFEHREPVLGVPLTVPAQRVRALRLDHPDEIGGLAIPPLTQYSIRVRANTPVVALFGRLDTTQPAMAYYSPAGYFESP